MRGLVRVAVRRRVTVCMVTLAVVAFGVVGYRRLSLELFPDISYPSLTVQTEFPNAAPQEVENLITRPVEEAVGVLRGLESIHSVSRSGVSEVTLEFDWGSDMDLLSMEVREKLDRLILPEETEDPIVLRYDPSFDPILRLALAGDEDLGEMRDLAERRIKQEFETIKGVAAARVQGGLEKEIHVDVDQERLAALGIPLERIRLLVGMSNVNLPGGSLRGEELQYLIRTVNEFDDVEEIANLIVWQSGSALVRLREVASVTMGAKEREVITRVNGRESVEIALYKEGDSNTVSVARAIEEKLDEWRDKLPPGYSLTVLFDQSDFIEQAVDEVAFAAAIGGLLAIAVLLAFLRDPRSTLIVGTSIPISVIATFMVMYCLDISLNVMSLGGLTLGIGMLVDNSIVVLESIFRRRQHGLDLARAAVEGTTEVGPAVIASTLTSVAVFLPIVFVEGIAGQLFEDQALTVTISLLASLLVAVTMIPMLSAVGGAAASSTAPQLESTAAPAALARDTGPPAAEEADRIMTLGVLSRAYDRLIRGAIRNRWAVLPVAFGLFAASFVALRWIDQELIPQLSEGEFFFEVRMAEGTSLEATDRIVRDMERVADAVPSISHYYSTTGSRLVAGGLSLNTKAENLGQFHVVLQDRGDDVAEAAAIETLRGQFEAVPDLDVKFGRPSYFSLKTPIEVIVYGEDLGSLRDYSLELVQRLEATPGLVDVRSSLESGNPEVQVIFDRERIASLGLQMDRLSETLKDRVQGVVPTRFKEGDQQIDVRVRNLETHRASVQDISRLVVPGPEDTPMRLLSVADVRLDRGPAEIHRLQQQRAAVVTANLQGTSLGAAIAAVEDVIATSRPPRGVSTEIGGQNREMQVSFNSLIFALALAVFLVYLVMASIFESFVHPFVVLFTIPLSLVGVVAGLMATSTPISVIVLIGGVMLIGIVVNNAIVLIDTINRLRRAGVEKAEAIVRAGHIRLRPILMTTATTVLGLLPMALAWGEGAELRAPLAITVASGLLLSTALTLVVVPAVYMTVPSRVGADDAFGEEALGDDSTGDEAGEVPA